MKKEKKKLVAVFAALDDFRPIFTVMTFVFVAVMLAGCSGFHSNPRVIPYAGGDACEHAKVVLIQRTQEHDDGFWKGLGTETHSLMQSARENVNALCKEEKDGTWACAEGHSCK